MRHLSVLTVNNLAKQQLLKTSTTKTVSSIRFQSHSGSPPSSASSVSDKASFPGYKGEFSTSLDFIYPENSPRIQCYRVMNRKGVLLDQNQDPHVKY